MLGQHRHNHFPVLGTEPDQRSANLVNLPFMGLARERANADSARPIQALTERDNNPTRVRVDTVFRYPLYSFFSIMKSLGINNVRAPGNRIFSGKKSDAIPQPARVASGHSTLSFCTLTRLPAFAIGAGLRTEAQLRAGLSVSADRLKNRQHIGTGITERLEAVFYSIIRYLDACINHY
jgi:hypothetical protein